MTIEINERNRIITNLLNGTNVSLKSIMPINYQMSKPQLLGKQLELQFGVLIAVTGDIKGSLILSGDASVFSYIGEAMFGMPLEGEMLSSFSGELGNMLAGRISTTIVENGIKTDITAPTIFQGNTTLSGYEKAIQITAEFDKVGGMDIYLLLY
ncbi:chemotaxis protein CheX [Oceanobacillus chungangensis]|uniref:Chemotaxis protein CheX n=1 Tax=Oceanobacillus chungangensis TaxID=1229152 RepID=A0A3D8PYA0_9BACI|nr:chemotaxis protein CheX [Oceanobacillus chungangensis]RDW20762.1 chemotaxis protein CheX [Oceanobacillus chungangensis]